MNREVLRPAAAAAAFAVLGMALFVALGGSPAAWAMSPGGAGSLQAAAATASPVPTAPPATEALTNTASFHPADDLTSATVELHGGYIMDPYLLPVVGKTELAASETGGCNGFVGRAPSVVVNWHGSTEQLSFFVYSDGDGVLAVQKPDGSFVCNDDAGARTVDPLVTIENPAAGAYKVHTGAATQGQPALGFLAISQAKLNDTKLATLDLVPMLQRRERPRVQALPQLDVRSLLTSREAIFGSAELRPGFKPVQAFAAGGGDIAAIKVEDGNLACAGYISAIPSYSFDWSGTPQAIRVYLEARKDSSLVIVSPEKEVLCGMNASAGNLNPIVDIAAPVTGRYQVYVASMEPGAVVGGKLTVTGDSRATPAALAPASQ